MPDLYTVEGVEIVAAGMEWPASTGPVTITMEHLADAMTAANDDPLVIAPRCKLGHLDPRFNSADELAHMHDPTFDGEPAFGRFVNLRLENDGAVLVADWVDIPEWLYESRSAYPNRSAELIWSHTTVGGRNYSMVVTAVALLGEFWPAITDLEDLQTVLAQGPNGLTAAAAAARTEEAPVPGGSALSVSVDAIATYFNFDWAMSNPIDGLDTYWWWVRDVRVDPDELIVDDGEGGLWSVPYSTDGAEQITFDDPVPVRETYVPRNEEQQAPAAAAFARRNQRTLATGLTKPDKQDPTSAAGVRPDTEEGDTLSTLTQDQLRRLRDLPEDATQEQIDAALAEPVEEPTGGAAAPEAEVEEPVVEEPTPEPVAAARGVTVDRDALSQLQGDAQMGREAREAQLASERQGIVDVAVATGKFPPAAKAGYLSNLAQGGEVERQTREFIEQLPEGTIPVDERGSAPSQDPAAAVSDGDHDDYMKRNFPHAARRRSHLTRTEA